MYAVELAYTRGPALRQYPDQVFEKETIEEAAQIFQSESGTNQPLAEIVEELSLEGKVEFEEDGHPWRVVTARELAAVV
jgi:hypothetical protein